MPKKLKTLISFSKHNSKRKLGNKCAHKSNSDSARKQLCKKSTRSQNFEKNPHPDNLEKPSRQLYHNSTRSENFETNPHPDNLEKPKSQFYKNFAKCWHPVTSTFTYKN